MYYRDMERAALEAEREKLLVAYGKKKAEGLSLNMARGKPGREQLDLSAGLLTVLSDGEACLADGIEARNYGELSGLPSARKLFAEILGVEPEECFVGGNSSLQLMYDTVAKAFTHGLLHSEKPWSRLEKVRFICPVPGYDRHFKILESFGVEMLTVPMTEEGPDMDAVEALVADPGVKGMWNVPKYANPTGVVYGEETVRRLAALRPAAPDFLLMWDQAYCIHDFAVPFRPFPDILSLAREAGNPDMPFVFVSTSKVTFPGAGVAAMACSRDNLAYMRKLMSVQTIGFDKVNQLRHVLFLQDKEHTLAHMERHAAILRPKFDTVLSALEKEIAPLGIAEWKRPQGGYFISLDAMEGTAKRTVALAKEAGVTLTDAGATYPYGKDPHDRNIRIAPTVPPLAELKSAIEILCLCLRLSAAEKLLEV